MHSIKLSSCMAPNADHISRKIATYLTEGLHLPVQAILDIPWQERERRLDAGEIDLCWICGLPYVWKADQSEPVIELLVAPVMEGKRYQDRPIYFSDVVVKKESPFQSFSDLRGSTWAYNEPGSHSGYNLIRFTLGSLGETSGYFGKVVESGSHETSLQMILSGEIDASAIDSTVLETEYVRTPDLHNQIRILQHLGPSPIPPWVVSKTLTPDHTQAIRQTMLDMHATAQGREILTSGRINRFVGVDDRDFDAIRAMERIAKEVCLIEVDH